MVHPDVLLAQLSSSQLTEWLGYLQLVDEDELRDRTALLELENQRVGLVAATTANFSPITKKHDFKPHDFVGGKPREPTASEKIRAWFGSIAGARKTKR